MRKTSLIKNIIYVFIIISLANCKEKDKNSFSISGKIKSIKNGHLILNKFEDFQQNKSILMDTIIVNKKGEFNSVYVLKPGVFQLKFKDKSVLLAIDKGQQIKIKGAKFNQLKIKGSKDTKLLEQYEKFRKTSLKRLVSNLRDSIKKLDKKDYSAAKIAKLRLIEVNNYQNHLKELMGFVKNNMGTSIAIYPTSTRWIGGEYVPFLDTLLLKFRLAHPNSDITTKLEERISILKRTSIGATLKNISLPDTSLTNINLKTVKGKFTLIDFWASWCPPCRTESVLLNNLYDLYHKKGFEIYSISLDSKKKPWNKAIKKDNRKWINVSNLQGFNSSEAKKLGITALPYNLIIDENQQIIAVNLYGEALKLKLNSLF